jgi:hypothetical protein
MKPLLECEWSAKYDVFNSESTKKLGEKFEAAGVRVHLDRCNEKVNSKIPRARQGRHSSSIRALTRLS